MNTISGRAVAAVRSLVACIGMHIPNFFHTVAGMYMAQSFFHSIIATIIASTALEVWKLESPSIRQRFRLSVILFSFFSFPVFQIINPERSGLFFRLDALFNSERWLELAVFGIVPGHVLLAAVFLATAMVFVFQELLPILKHLIEPSLPPQIAVIKPSEDSPVGRIARSLPQPAPDVFIMHEDELLLFSTTRKKRAIYISTGLALRLTGPELRASLAHEMAHISRSRKSVLLAGFVLRTFMFFNPIALIEFRRAIRNEEKICDDIAVSLTGDPAALAAALRKLHIQNDEQPAGESSGRPPAKVTLEDYSYTLQLDSRIARLLAGRAPSGNAAWFPFLYSFGTVCVITYFVV